MNTSEPAVGVRLRIDFDGDTGGLELRGHFIEIANAEIHHPGFCGITEVFGVFFKRSERRGPSLLLPGRFSVTGWDQRNSQMLLVPASQGGWIVGSEE